LAVPESFIAITPKFSFLDKLRALITSFEKI